MLEREIISEWMVAAAQRLKAGQFDDLHVDQIDPAWKEKKAWIEAGFRALSLAESVREKLTPDLRLVLAFSLLEGDQLAPPSSRRDLYQQMDWSPPSLYLFRSGQEPWTCMSNGYAPKLRASFTKTWECYYLCFHSNDTEELCRSMMMTLGNQGQE